MQPETNKIPDWAAQEREADLSWINENLDLFWQTAVAGASLMGKEAIVVDVATKPMGNGNLFTYFAQVELERFEDEDINRLLGQYEPDSELVVMLLKPKDRISSYQIRPFSSQKG